MAQVTVKNIEEEKEWEDYLSRHPKANFLQSWYWGEFHNALGNEIQRSGFYKNGKLIGVMLSIVEKARRARYLTIPGGPIIDWKDVRVVSSFVGEIKKIAKSTNCAFVRVRPQLEKNEFSKKIFSDYKFVGAPMYLHAELTSQLDIKKSEQELLSQMRKNTRREIKKAILLGIKVSSSSNPSSIKQFFKLQTLTAKRQRFVPFSYKYLYEEFKAFSKTNRVLVYTAYFGNKLLTMAFIIFYGKEAVYHHGASTLDGRKYPGAYVIQWEAVKEAKKRGCTRYNFWGVASPNDTNHRFYGVSVFKRGFGGYDLQYLPAQDLIIDYPRYALNFAIETLRRKIRKL